MTRSAEARERLKSYSRELYNDRKSRQVCVYCEAALGPDDGTVCSACEEERAPRADVYRFSKHGAKVRNKAQRAFIDRRLEAGLCIVCATPRDQWSAPSEAQAIKRAALARKGKHPQKCPTCADEYSVYHRRRDELARQGVLDLVRERKRRAKEERIAAAKEALAARKREVRRYVPVDELVAATRVRVLRGLSRMDWTTAGDLFLALEIDEDSQSLERDRYAQTLSRLSRAGALVERRESAALFGGEQYEYRITERGRAELEKAIRTCRA